VDTWKGLRVTVELWVLAGLVLLLAAAGVAGRYAAAHLGWRVLYARRVVVNLKTGRALDGLLVRRAGDLLFLREATALEPGAEPVRLDGDAVVGRADIDFIQAL
jgi:hypothetical protein